MTIRSAYGVWPHYNRRLSDVVAAMTGAQLGMQPAEDRWPLWATVGHLACQRVFWLCDVAGEPGAETTPFTDASYNCPGDDDLEHVLDAAALVQALDSTFAIVERCLDRWVPEALDEEVRLPGPDPSSAVTRGWIVQRAFSHDVYHCAELNEALGHAGLPQINLWSS